MGYLEENSLSLSLLLLRIFTKWFWHHFFVAQNITKASLVMCAIKPFKCSLPILTLHNAPFIFKKNFWHGQSMKPVQIRSILFVKGEFLNRPRKLIYFISLQIYFSIRIRLIVWLLIINSFLFKFDFENQNL